ncbi:MAG: hypothetical protein IPK33_14920 [Gemmatimonadetes bacterium]|nr:hypothetical protein [Gemmatimonadota bacterium]
MSVNAGRWIKFNLRKSMFGKQLLVEGWADGSLILDLQGNETLIPPSSRKGFHHKSTSAFAETLVAPALQI